MHVPALDPVDQVPAPPPSFCSRRFHAHASCIAVWGSVLTLVFHCSLITLAMPQLCELFASKMDCSTSLFDVVAPPHS